MYRPISHIRGKIAIGFSIFKEGENKEQGIQQSLYLVTDGNYEKSVENNPFLDNSLIIFVCIEI